LAGEGDVANAIPISTGESFPITGVGEPVFRLDLALWRGGPGRPFLSVALSQGARGLSKRLLPYAVRVACSDPTAAAASIRACCHSSMELSSQPTM
jgi:hypothetical protein